VENTKSGTKILKKNNEIEKVVVAPLPSFFIFFSNFERNSIRKLEAQEVETQSSSF